jgi:hypothetical protein
VAEQDYSTVELGIWGVARLGCDQLVALCCALVCLSAEARPVLDAVSM